ncbi:hypothetical protein Cpin_1393 [Chitinophaga pinensis DSM 2588]|uniref:Uncharacterized protein n=1 Tax=Chitinophaga pinensis (strain ATCC 43595 / DSM 2588 / LMG 13176 / NBRC 15968 / NCIMB 11800 / UQM 2034) TaxID=485918 RepID=A0A979G122_CHIPD|nr:hypothetical protein Cpin_1393 [Chitinophaga pinensis DSM 2588]
MIIIERDVSLKLFNVPLKKQSFNNIKLDAELMSDDRSSLIQ